MRRRLTDRVDLFLRRRREALVIAFCACAAVRVLVYSAAYPLFNSTDEQAYFDAVHKYARGYHLEKALPRMDPESARIFTLYGSAEYLGAPDVVRSRRLERPLATSPAAMSARVGKIEEFWMRRHNVEAHSPPLYYFIAGGWYNLGQILRLKEWRLAYWVRSLNVFLYTLLVYLSWLFMKQVWPKEDFLGMAVPALLAFFPQDVFYGINRAVLSAPLGAAALLVLARLLQKPGPSLPLALAGGLAVGLALLSDFSNIVLLAALGGAFVARARRADTLGPELPAMLCGFSAAFLPLAILMRHFYLALGDPSGSRAKFALLGWTIKPLGEVMTHPVFTGEGLGYFLQAAMKSFWRGDSAWHGKPMAWATADWLYIVSSYLLVLVAAAHLLRRPPAARMNPTTVGRLCLSLIVAAPLFLILISLPIDFHACAYPTRLRPFFVSGRIISAVLVPFSLLYVWGLERLLRPVRKWVHPALVLGGILLFVAFSEFFARKGVFFSVFNLFAYSQDV